MNSLTNITDPVIFWIFYFLENIFKVCWYEGQLWISNISDPTDQTAWQKSVGRWTNSLLISLASAGLCISYKKLSWIKQLLEKTNLIDIILVLVGRRSFPNWNSGEITSSDGSPHKTTVNSSASTTHIPSKRPWNLHKLVLIEDPDKWIYLQQKYALIDAARQELHLLVRHVAFERRRYSSHSSAEITPRSSIIYSGFIANWMSL